MHGKRSVKVAIAASAAVLIGGGVAVAFWTAGGTGSGSVTTDTTQALTVIQTSQLTKLTPGSPAVPLSGMVLNPNHFTVHVNAVTAAVGNMPGTGCDPAWFDITGTVAPMEAVFNTDPTLNRLNLWSGLNIALRNESTVNQDGCKGLAVPIVYTVN
jgi:hypothetical protein